ncbi:MAG: hypothetical protein V4494_04765 [Chlamydiota bacterium]
MIIAVCSRIKIDQILQNVTLSALIASGISAIFGVSSFFFSSWQNEQEIATSFQTAAVKDAEKSLFYSSIGSGALVLKRTEFCPLMMRLKEEVMILAQNTRPDVQDRETKILVRLKSTSKELAITSGMRLYLEDLENQLVFSSVPTEFWIKPICLEDGGLLLEAEREGEKAEWLGAASQVLGKRVGERFWDQEFPLFVRSMKEAKFWGLDLLVQHYAGVEHGQLRDKYKLMIGDSIYFVSKGDFLTWVDHRWEISSLGKNSEHVPLAQVKNAGPKGIELDVWDEVGFQIFQVKLDNVHFAKQSGSHVDQTPTMIRLRTASQITCNLGKRRLILKEGDWLLRTSAGWRKLKTAAEIDECLFHKVQGELLIFDKLEKLQGKTILHAHLFDSMRTQVQLLSIPVAAEKKKTLGGKL